MANLKINGTEFYYEDHGSKTAPAIVLSPLLYTDTTVFEPMIRSLEDEYRVICYDHRGLGKSARPASRSIANSAKDVASLIEQLDAGPCHFFGNCLGAFVGLQLAISRSDLLRSCTLTGVSAEADKSEKVQQMDAFIDQAKTQGMKDSVKAFADMWFGSTFKASKDPIQVTRRERWLKHLEKLSEDEVEAARQIFHREDLTKDLSKVHCPTLILCGDEDRAESIEASKKVANSIANAEFKMIHHAGYALVIEQPEEVAEMLRTFVGKVERRLSQKSKQAPREDFSRPSL